MAIRSFLMWRPFKYLAGKQAGGGAPACTVTAWLGRINLPDFQAAAAFAARSLLLPDRKVDQVHTRKTAELSYMKVMVKTREA
jgi:hypothetical protein